MNRICRYAFFLVGVGFVMAGRAQKPVEPSQLKHFNITVNFDDYTVKTQMLSHSKRISTDNERTYMWYSSQKLIETRGGYDGKLIHGAYRSFYLNNQLREQGRMQYGLRCGEWKYWYADGKLKEVIRWRKGRKHGTYLLYNDYGQLMAKSRFKNDKLHGKFYTYGANGVVMDTKRYRHGQEIVPTKKTKSKQGFLFKKKIKKQEEGVQEKKGPEKNKKKSWNFFKRKPAPTPKTKEPAKTVST